MVRARLSSTLRPLTTRRSYSLPGPQSTQQNNALVFSSSTGNAISIADVDAGAGTLSMTLIANQGTLTLGSLLGLAAVTGNGSGTVVLSGTLADLNDAREWSAVHPCAWL